MHSQRGRGRLGADPAFHCGVVRGGTSEEVPGRHVLDDEVRAEVHCGHILADCVGRLASVRGVPVSELPVSIFAKAFDVAARREGADKVSARSHSGCFETGAQVDCRERISHFARLVAAPESVALTKLPILRLSPTLHLAIRAASARKVATALDLDGVEVIAEIDDRQRVAELARGIAEIGRVAVAQLAVPVVADALHFRVGRQGASMVEAEAHLLNLEVRAPVDGHQIIPHFVAAVAALSGAADAELAIVVAAEAFTFAQIRHSARVVPTGIHSDGIKRVAQIHVAVEGLPDSRRAADAQLAVPIVALFHHGRRAHKAHCRGYTLMSMHSQNRDKGRVYMLFSLRQ